MNRSLAVAVLALAMGVAHGQAQPDPPAQVATAYTHATRYDVQGRVTATIAPDPDGGGALGYPATRNTYGAEGTATSGLLVKVEIGQLVNWQDQYSDPQAWSGFQVHQTKLITYDDRARKAKETLLGQNGQAESLVEYSYDYWERLQCKAVRMNPAAFGSAPGACEQGTPGAFGHDRISRYTYDTLGQLLTEERAVGTPLAQAYVTNTYGVTNPSGATATKLLRSQTDAKGNRTELEYDANLRLKKRIYPSPTAAGTVNAADFNEYQYDANGNVNYERKRDSRSISYEYDANNRLVFKNLSDNTYSGDIAYTYDLRGLTLASCFGTDKFDDDCQDVSGGEGESNTFDDFGNLEKRTSTMGGVKRELTYAYDFEGNRLRVTHPDGYFFQYGFDGLNRMNGLGESASPTPGAGTTALLTIDYGATGHRKSIARTGGALTSILPDNALRLGSFTQNLLGTANDLTNAFGYNPASQVVSLSQSNTQYNYTDAQNRAGGYGVNGLNQYTQIDGEPLHYDLSGNLDQDRAPTGQLISYTYDLENHLVATAGPVASTLKYDTLGRLSRITLPGGTTQFLYDGDALVAEYLNGALTNRYVHGDQVDEPLLQYAGTDLANRRYLHADHQGSIVAQSDSTGAATQKNAYDPYGIPAVTNDGRFGYTGQTWLKELGLNYYKARIYSPKLGRFLQTDPIFYADDMNVYSYVGNDPLNKIDPTGTDSCETANPDGTAGPRIPNCIGDPKGPSTPKQEADTVVDEIVVTAHKAKGDKKIQKGIRGDSGEVGFKTEDGVLTSVDLIPKCTKGDIQAFAFPPGFLTNSMSSAGHIHNSDQRSGLGPHDAAMALQVGLNIQIDSRGTRGIAKLSTGSAIAVSANGNWGAEGKSSTAKAVSDLANATKGGSSNAPSTSSPCL